MPLERGSGGRAHDDDGVEGRAAPYHAPNTADDMYRRTSTRCGASFEDGRRAFARMPDDAPTTFPAKRRAAPSRASLPF